MANTKKGGKKKKKSFHAPWSQLLTPASLASYGGLAAVGPNTAITADQEWTQCWQIYTLRRGDWENVHQGHIYIEYKPKGGSAFMTVDQANIQGPQKAVCVTTASVVCCKDPLLTPTSWSLETVLRKSDGSVVPDTELRKAMKIEAGAVQCSSNGRTSTRRLPGGPVTSNWNLLGTLPFIRADKTEFTMLDELDKIKAGHRLYRSGDTTIPVNGKDVNVRCYHQIGHGCLPWEYYVDPATNRLLLALSGLRAYILDAKAATATQKILAYFKKRGGKKR